MSSLLRLQSQFAGAMVRGTDRAVAAMVAVGGIAAERRVAIHRNHYRITLTNALAATFPALRHVVGESAFAIAAAGFIRWQQPESPCLHEYGQAFPKFLASAPQSVGRPYLVDLGRFEWAINRAFHAPEVAPLAAGRLLEFSADETDRLVFVPQPSLTLIHSRFALDEIWEAAQVDAPERRPPASGTGTYLAIMRRGTSVKWWSLAGWEWDFLRRLVDGRSFGDAVSAAADRDIARLFAGILQAGVLADVALFLQTKGTDHVANDRHTHAGL